VLRVAALSPAHCRRSPLALRCAIAVTLRISNGAFVRTVIFVLTFVCLIGCGSGATKRAREELDAATAAASRGDTERALEHLDSSIGIQPTGDAYLLRSQIHANKGLLNLSTDDIAEGLQIEPTHAGLVEQKSSIEHFQKELEEQEKQRIAQREADAKERKRRAVEEAAVAKKEAQELQARAYRENLIEELTFILGHHEDYWATKAQPERAAYVEAIAANGNGRLEAEIAGRKAYWEARYLSSDEPLSADKEEKKAREFVAKYLRGGRESAPFAHRGR
jgi:hypothetical protein